MSRYNNSDPTLYSLRDNIIGASGVFAMFVLFLSVAGDGGKSTMFCRDGLFLGVTAAVAVWAWLRFKVIPEFFKFGEPALAGALLASFVFTIPLLNFGLSLQSLSENLACLVSFMGLGFTCGFLCLLCGKGIKSMAQAFLPS